MSLLNVQSPDGTALILSGAPGYHLAADYIGHPAIDSTYIFANQC